MGLFRKIRLHSELRPILATAFLYEVAFSTFWSYVGLFSVERLGASDRGVGILFLVSAAPAGVANYLSGRLSDRVVRKRLIASSFAANTLVVLGLVASGGQLLIGFSLVVVAGIVGAPAYTLSLTLIADVVESERRELAYARLRVAQNLGIAIGPPLGGSCRFGSRAGSSRCRLPSDCRCRSSSWAPVSSSCSSRDRSRPSLP
jgi:predicted MFS family arabinose efflux permease